MALRASAIMRINCIDDDRDHNPNGNKGTCNPEVNSTLRYQYNVLYNVHFTILIFLPLSFGPLRKQQHKQMACLWKEIGKSWRAFPVCILSGSLRRPYCRISSDSSWIVRPRVTAAIHQSSFEVMSRYFTEIM